MAVNFNMLDALIKSCVLCNLNWVLDVPDKIKLQQQYDYWRRKKLDLKMVLLSLEGNLKSVK